ncbi:MAG: S-adenosylmethionine decarboxylase proenzyme [Armatimonadetes bacterium]|nr:S-adenosylmethionine decarboxylase proenzyme [Armatimonadota bacterium]
MKALGKHIIIELSFCNQKILGDLSAVKEIMVGAALEAKAEIREVIFHKFAPQGISGVIVIAESHLSIHTWPEYNYAAVDIYTCGKKTKPWRASKYLEEKFEAQSALTTEIKRGVARKNGSYAHNISA